MVPILEQIIRTKMVEDAQGNQYSMHPVSIPVSEGMALYELVKAAKVRRTLEVGMAYGVSTLFICQALQENGGGKHLVIDPFQATKWHAVGLTNLERAGFRDMVTWHNAYSHTALPQLLEQGTRIEMAFIDGSHRFDDAFIDFYYIDRMLAVGGYLVFDDLWMASIRRLLAFILRNYGYTLHRDFDQRAVSALTVGKRFAHAFIKQPFDPYLLFSSPGPGWRLLHLRQNYCILKKISERKEGWDFYQSF